MGSRYGPRPGGPIPELKSRRRRSGGVARERRHFFGIPPSSLFPGSIPTSSLFQNAVCRHFQWFNSQMHFRQSSLKMRDAPFPSGLHPSAENCPILKPRITSEIPPPCDNQHIAHQRKRCDTQGGIAHTQLGHKLALSIHPRQEVFNPHGLNTHLGQVGKWRTTPRSSI